MSGLQNTVRPERLVYLDKMLKRWVEEDRQPAIAVKAMLRGTPVFKGIYGPSFTDEPLSLTTIFPVMSISKPIIAILLHILQEDGLVDLVDPVRSYLPDFVPGGRDKICLWHLLSHISGLPDGNRDPDAPLAAEPGKVISYNSFGYDVAKDVITAVTGESIDAFARRVLFGPLGMADSHWKLPREKWSRVIGRKPGILGYPWANSPEKLESEDGGGGLKSTVNDMLVIMEMMRGFGEYNGVRVLSPASVRSMITNHNTDGFSEYDAWGLGWGIRGNKKEDSGLLCSPRTIEHGGWAGCKILCDYDSGLTYAYFSLIYEFDEQLRPEDEKFYRPRFTNVLTSALL